MSDCMVGADDGIMVSQSGLTKRAVRSVQAKHIALASMNEDATEHDFILLATALV